MLDARAATRPAGTSAARGGGAAGASAVRNRSGIVFLLRRRLPGSEGFLALRPAATCLLAASLLLSASSIVPHPSFSSLLSPAAGNSVSQLASHSGARDAYILPKESSERRAPEEYSSEEFRHDDFLAGSRASRNGAAAAQHGETDTLKENDLLSRTSSGDSRGSPNDASLPKHFVGSTVSAELEVAAELETRAKTDAYSPLPTGVFPLAERNSISELEILTRAQDSTSSSFPPSSSAMPLAPDSPTASDADAKEAEARAKKREETDAFLDAILEGAASPSLWREPASSRSRSHPSASSPDGAVALAPPSLASVLVSGLSEHLASSFPLFNSSPMFLADARRAVADEPSAIPCLLGPGGLCAKTPTPAELLGLLNEGTEWILTPTATVLQSIGRTMDRVFSGFVLRTARALPNYRRNVIISYRDFKPFMLLDMLAQRNRFLHHLSSLFSSLQPIRSIYLRNLGMEIFELPDVLGLGEFTKAALGLRQYVDQIFEDQEVTDFDREKYVRNDEELFAGEYRGTPSAAESTGDHTTNAAEARGQAEEGGKRPQGETSGREEAGDEPEQASESGNASAEEDEQKTAEQLCAEYVLSTIESSAQGETEEKAFEACLQDVKEKLNDKKPQSPAASRRLQVLPNDPFTWKQWPFTDSGSSRWGTEAPKAWELWTGADMRERLTVAVIDSGVDYRHPDLRNMIWHNQEEICNNGIDDDRNGLVDDCLGWDFIHGDNDPDDDNGHGTASAGIIAAEPNNHIGMAGICWGCKIMILKALNKDIKGTVSSFARAIDYALGKGVKISNNSYGGRGSGFHGLEQAVERARAAGMVFVAAAGNYNGNNDNDKDPVFPASYPLDNIISVAAITRAGSLASFSSYGKTQVDIAAPGSQITSTSLNGTYRTVEGTSFAVPFVTGAVALVWSRFPYLPYREVIDRILRNAKYNAQLNGYIATSGVLDVWKALTDGAGSLPLGEPLAPLPAPGAVVSQCADLRCHPLATCVVSSPFQRACHCPQGYQGNGYECRDIDECAFSPCGPASVCRNLPGSFECRCREGFKQVNDTCVDIDECREPWAAGMLGQACPVQAICQNFSGSFDCVCPPGAVWNAQSGYNAQCLTLNTPPTGPCVNNGGCGINALCQTSSSVLYYQRTCVCLNGYEKLNASFQGGLLGDGRDICVREGLLESEIRRYLAIMQSFTAREAAGKKSIEAVSGPPNATPAEDDGGAKATGTAADILTGGWLWPRSPSPPPSPRPTPASNAPVSPCFLGICLLGSASDASA